AFGIDPRHHRGTARRNVWFKGRCRDDALWLGRISRQHAQTDGRRYPDLDFYNSDQRIIARLGAKARTLAACLMTRISPANPMQRSIEIKSLGKVYQHPVRPLQALSRISLSVAQGQFVSIVGASGCGKSTLLQIVAGLIEASEGEVLVEGAPVTGPM